MAVTVLRKGDEEVVVDENTSLDERDALLKQGFAIDKGATIEQTDDGLFVKLSKYGGPTGSSGTTAKAERPKLGANNPARQ
jgi:hypothetical protein